VHKAVALRLAPPRRRLAAAVTYQVDETLNEPVWYSRVPNNLKKPFAWIMASGQTIRWATQQVVLQDILSGKDMRNLSKG
jgi:hypothetical protein